jgi:predicted dehydrogenase
MKQINLLIIGFGRHCKRIHHPLYEKYKTKFNISLKGIIDLESQKNDIENYLKKIQWKLFPQDFDKIYFKDKKINQDFKLNKSEIIKLNNLKSRYNINAIILSSEPSSHKAYIDWALENDINILLDKPITSRKNSSMNEKEATNILKDHIRIEKKYLKKLQKNKDLLISCMSQRRYHPAMDKISEEISKVSKLTNCPVTSITALHSDGQWRMPQEILDEKYHGYNEGYGKCSHSGYHFLDMISLFLDKSIESCNNKHLNSVKINSSFVRPIDVLNQLNYVDYEKIFGKEFKENTTENNFNSKKFRNMGEVDAFINFAFQNKSNHKICSVNLSLIHNGFSKRSWFEAKNDLYKGNGRVRHECFIIEQGPLQSIHYHSYQSDEIRNSDLSTKSEVGGELHSEVLIFRNSKLLNGKAFEKINFGEIKPNDLEGYSRGHQEEARGNCFVEFFEFLQDRILRDNLKSDLFSHKHGVTLMAGTYISGTKEFRNKSSLVKMKYN